MTQWRDIAARFPELHSRSSLASPLAVVGNDFGGGGFSIA
jgi:hypothetical protein